MFMSGKCNFILTRPPLNILISLVKLSILNRITDLSSHPLLHVRVVSLIIDPSSCMCAVYLSYVLRNTLLPAATVSFPFPLIRFRCCCSRIRSLISVVAALLEHIFSRVIFLNFRESVFASSRPSV